MSEQKEGGEGKGEHHEADRANATEVKAGTTRETSYTLRASDTHKISYWGSDLVMFTISEFLPGEYVLCTFPLICKATNLLRLSLSLRKRISTFDFESVMVRINQRRHLITALFLKEDDSFQFQSNLSSNNLNSTTVSSQNMISAFASVKELTLSGPNSSFFSTYLSLHYFPRLTKLSFGWCRDGVADQLLSELWGVSTLTSLYISECTFNADIAERYTRGDCGPPAFAQTLRSLETSGHELAVVVLDMLASYCKNLQHIEAENYHDGIMMNNPRLTSLHLSNCASSSAIDLTPHHHLITLHLCEPGQLSSSTIHSNLEHISLFNPHRVDCAVQFLTQCPALKQASVMVGNWQDLVKIISVLNPDRCKQLKLLINPPRLKSNILSFPSVDEVDNVLLQKGFRVNEDFLFEARDAVEQWGRIVSLVPGIQYLEKLEAGHILDHFFRQQHLLPSFFTSFRALTTLDAHTGIDWNQEMLSSIVKTCARLKTLKLYGRMFSGICQLESFSLHKVHLRFTSHLSVHFNLPNLRDLQLSLRGGEHSLLQGILDGGDPLIQLPLLRVLDLHLGHGSVGINGSILCNVGHGSLTKLTITGDRESEMEKLTLQNVPSLQKLILKSKKPPHLVLDIPCRCDIFLVQHDFFGPDDDAEEYPYQRKGCDDNGAPNNFVAELFLRGDEKGWVEHLGEASTLNAGEDEKKKKKKKKKDEKNNNKRRKRL